MIEAPNIYYDKNNLMVEGITVVYIINEVSTPAYIYSKSSFIDQLNRLAN